MKRAALLLLLALPAAAIEPYALECEARLNPEGIDTARPRLGWKLKSPAPADRQTAYQILAASTPEKLAANTPDLWDSARIVSSDTLWIPYAGKPLQPLQRVHWKVRVWDAAGKPSEYSQPATFLTALLDPAQWRGAWIVHPNTNLTSGPLPLFRKQFDLSKPLKQAVVLISGAGFHELRINGAKVGDHVLAPAWTNYRATMLYETFDVTALLKPGPNALGVMLGNGFYNVAGGRYVKYNGSFGQPRLSLFLRLTFDDGSTQDITTDTSWRTQLGPITFSCIFGGEDYDARLEISNWDQPNYDDSAWPHARGVEAPGGTMTAQSSPPIKVQRTFQPVKVTSPRPGLRVYDLGQNFAGWPRISVSGPAGAQVKIIPGELLDKDGLVSQRSSGGPNSFTYTLKGAGREAWAPRFTYYGFRYLQVETTATVHEIAGEFVHLDAPRTGSFESSNTRFNKIHALIDAAVRSNLQHVITDCPHREKLGWLEQTHLMGPSLLYNWDLRTFFPKMFRDIREAQLTSGLVPDIAPEYVVFRGGFRDSPEWGSASVLVPWLDWQWYADKDALAAAYPSMKAYVHYLLSQTKDGLLSHGLGDWYDIGPNPPGRSQLTPLGVTATAVLIADLDILQRAAVILGHPDEAARFSAQSNLTRLAFQKAFYKPAENTYATGSQTSLAMPLALDIAPQGARQSILENLVRDIRARGNHTTAGDVGYAYVIRALTEARRSGVVFDMANNDTPPSYAGQLNAGATSLAEAWDANPASSQNHLMLGHIEEWFYAALAGIRIDPFSPGLTKVRIEPQPAGDVTWVKASVDTPRGPVAVHWRIDNGVFHLSLDVPPGLAAQVRLPGQEPKPAASGHHELSAPMPASAPARSGNTPGPRGE